MSPDLRDLANKKAPHVDIRRTALKEGLISLRSDGMAKVAAGVTTVEEVLRVSHDDDHPLYQQDLEGVKLLEQVSG